MTTFEQVSNSHIVVFFNSEGKFFLPKKLIILSNNFNQQIACLKFFYEIKKNTFEQFRVNLKSN